MVLLSYNFIALLQVINPLNPIIRLHNCMIIDSYIMSTCIFNLQITFSSFLPLLQITICIAPIINPAQTDNDMGQVMLMMGVARMSVGVASRRWFAWQCDCCWCLSWSCDAPPATSDM